MIKLNHKETKQIYTFKTNKYYNIENVWKCLCTSFSVNKGKNYPYSTVLPLFREFKNKQTKEFSLKSRYMNQEY